MKKLVSVIAIVVMSVPALAADNGTARGRQSLASQMIAAPRVSSVNQLGMGGTISANNSMARVRRDADAPKEGDDSTNSGNGGNTGNDKPAVDMREKEKAACLNNNIGIGNTFVWASRYSNTGNYASMVEDIEHPENNTCFVKVEISSDDSRIQVSDIPAKYFEWGTNITCGSWADEAKLRQRILDAKKSARTWGTVAGAVGGAAVGVGIMELFGNKLIGGAVQGQKANNISKTDFVVARLLTFKNQGDTELVRKFVRQAEIMRDECKKLEATPNNKNTPDICTSYDWDAMVARLK